MSLKYLVLFVGMRYQNQQSTFLFSSNSIKRQSANSLSYD